MPGVVSLGVLDDDLLAAVVHEGDAQGAVAPEVVPADPAPLAAPGAGRDADAQEDGDLGPDGAGLGEDLAVGASTLGASRSLRGPDGASTRTAGLMESPAPADGLGEGSADNLTHCLRLERQLVVAGRRVVDSRSGVGVLAWITRPLQTKCRT